MLTSADDEVQSENDDSNNVSLKGILNKWVMLKTFLISSAIFK